MPSNDRIKVVGYAQRVFYDNGIEYRNFSDDLVGNQLTADADGTNSTFTFGNFVTTVNYEGRTSRIFSTKKFSNFYSLETLKLDDKRVNTLLNNNINTIINIDKTNLSNFAYFGSATEFVRVALEKIITNWPASLYLNPFRTEGINTIFGNTYSNYAFNLNTNESTFSVDTNFIINNFDINYKTNGTIINTFNEENDLRNLTVNYFDYVIYINDTEYPIIGFTGSSSELNDTLYFSVDGNPFDPTVVTSTTIEYHIKPKSELEEEFFNSLNEYESYLLNRLSNPKYTSKYVYKVEVDDGSIVTANKTLTWPVSDGYNIDFNTAEYARFVSELLQITNGKDGIETNLMTRFLTSESISDFDTIPKCDGSEEETAGQKMNKTLKIYGREFDEIKKYIDGISFANVVTYNKLSNTPDQLVKYLARVLGWELTSSLVENDLVNNYLKLGSNTYPGYSRGLSPNEAEVELWRRLILNSAHIWKSKGTRNPIEFFFKMIGTPDGLIDFNEHVYVAKEPIDMDLFYKVLEYNNLPDDLSLYNVDEDGYPKFFRDTRDMYFQKGGGWYRETAGSAATQYTLMGNNPHVGPYDSGYEYIAQLENIIPNFTAFTITSTTVTTGTTQLFNNYNNGLMNNYNGETYIDPVALDGSDLSNVVLLETKIIDDFCPQSELTDCGCEPSEEDDSLIINFEREKPNCESLTVDCYSDDLTFRYLNSKYNTNTIYNYNYYQWVYRLYDFNGNPASLRYSMFGPKTCCETRANGYPYYHESFNRVYTNGTSLSNHLSNGGTLYDYVTSDFTWTKIDSGYVCCISQGIIADNQQNGCGCDLSCQWELVSPSLNDMYLLDNIYYLKFRDPSGNLRVVNEADSCWCPTRTGLVRPYVITDPYTNKKGYGCGLTANGRAHFMTNNNYDTNFFYVLYKLRQMGQEKCDEIGLTYKLTLPRSWYE